jgi:hypothetical protein
MEYFGSTITGTRIHTLEWLRIPFSTHDVLYRSTLQCLLQLATDPKASYVASLMIISQLTKRRERQLLYVVNLLPGTSNACQVKLVFERVEASHFSMVSLPHISQSNIHKWETWAHRGVPSISRLIGQLCSHTADQLCSLLCIFAG